MDQIRDSKRDYIRTKYANFKVYLISVSCCTSDEINNNQEVRYNSLFVGTYRKKSSILYASGRRDESNSNVHDQSEKKENNQEI